MITATLYSDPGCPWAYSEWPALRVLQWRYGDQLDWHLRLIGLTETAQQYIDRGYRPDAQAINRLSFRRYGMPFASIAKPRISATARACRAVIAAGQATDGGDWAAFRALQLINFTSDLVLDDDASLGEVLDLVPGLDGAAIVAALDSDPVTTVYEADKAAAREAAGTAAELQGKTAQTDGPVRYTAPSIVFARNGTSLVAGGFQPVEAYDVCVANLDPAVTRAAPPEDVGELLERFADGLTTQETAALMTEGNDAVDRPAAERALIALVGDGRARRVPLGDDAVWVAA